jgi:hypothetical protein
MFVKFDEFGNVSAVSERELNGYLKAPEGFDEVNRNAKLAGDPKDYRVILMSDEELLSIKKDKIIQKIKDTGNEFIRTFNGRTYTQEQWILKSQNFQDYKSTYCIKIFTNTIPNAEESERFQFACKMLDRKDRYVERINQLESLILNMAASEIDQFDPDDQSHWANVEE